MAVACQWRQWPVSGGSGLSMVAVACQWRQLVHGSGSFIEASYSWRPLVHRGYSFMAVACLWQLCVNTVGLSIAEVHHSLETICFPSKLRFVAIFVPISIAVSYYS
jgi:hypothetical protein